MKHYLYRHIRLDTGEPFYIGVGTKDNRTHITMSNEYYRAHSKSDRSSFWKKVVNKTNYEVEILLESDSYEFIKQKEVEFIKLYGRKDLGLGTLVNLTDGGEGSTNVIVSDETRKKTSLRHKGKKREGKALENIKKGTQIITKYHRKERKGERHITNEGLYVTIIKYNNSKNCTIEFEDGYVLSDRSYSDIKRGEVRHPHNFLFNGLGYLGIGDYKTKQPSGKQEKAFTLWLKLQKECTESREKIVFFEDWKNYQNFAKWYEENYVEGFVVNRTLLQKENKIYSPETCCFVPPEINILKKTKSKNNSTVSVGAIKFNNKYRAMFNKKHLGLFNTVEEATEIYNLAKKSYIKDLAYKWEYKIKQKTFEALINYKI